MVPSPPTEGRSGPAWRAVVELARAQANVFTGAQAARLGVPASTLRARATREGWARPFPGVYVLPGARVEGVTRAVAAAHAVGARSVLTGRTALILAGVVDGRVRVADIVLPADVHRHPRPGVRLRRSRTLRGGDVRPFHGTLLATIPRAFLDACVRADRATLRGWLIDGAQRRLLEVGEVRERVASEPRAEGRRRLLQACADIDGSGADSALVHEVVRWLRREGIALDRSPRTVTVNGRVLHPDITVAGVPVAIEVDGFGAHATRRTLERDQRKHNAYQLAGWTVLRLGWDRFTRDPDGFLAELRAAIARAASDPR